MFGKTILKWIVLAANIVALFFMIMTLLGTVISPERFTLFAYFALIYPVFIILNIGFVVLWLFARKWYFLLSLTVLLFSTTQISETIPIHLGKKDTLITSKPIHILTYNMMMGGKLVKHTKKNPNNKVIQYILDTNADIVCLQEFMVSRNKEYQTHADMLKCFKTYPYKYICYVQSEKSRLYGIATLSKFPIIKKQRIYYPSYTNASIYTDIKINNETIRVINNHLESNRLTDNDKSMPLKLKDNFDAEHLKGITLHFSRKLGVAYKLRAHQADEVAKVVKNSPYKIILCGDFNDVPASYAYTTVKGDLNDSFAETGTGLGWTYSQGLYKFRIDYVMYDSTLFAPVNYVSDKVKYSDHYPVKCDLVFLPSK